MKTRTAKVTSKRQVTLPKDLTVMLGIEPGDRLVFTEERDGRIHVEKATDWVQRTASILGGRASKRPPSPKTERRLFEESVADEVVNSMNRP